MGPAFFCQPSPPADAPKGLFLDALGVPPAQLKHHALLETLGTSRCWRAACVQGGPIGPSSHAPCPVLRLQVVKACLHFLGVPKPGCSLADTSLPQDSRKLHGDVWTKTASELGHRPRPLTSISFKGSEHCLVLAWNEPMRTPCGCTQGGPVVAG